MVEWKFPIGIPRMQTDEFIQKKAAYVEKEGYYVTVPRLGDIIRLKYHREPDKKEFRLWRNKNFHALGAIRYNEITEQVATKRRRYNTMLASPTPTWAVNVASVMTFFDDVNDTLGTIGVIARFAAHFAPKALARVLLGPIGWIFIAADLFGLIMSIMRLPFACVIKKRNYGRANDMNPFSKNARTVRAKKLRKVLPSKGELIEMAQTSNNVFGIGLSLGPILGFGYDVLSGAVRQIRGEKVTWAYSPPGLREHEKPGLITLRNAQIMAAAGQVMTQEEHLAYMLVLNGATQVLKPYIDAWNPIDHVEGLQHALIRAPVPKYPTTLFVLEENGVLPGQKIGWTVLDKEWATIEELWDANQPLAAKQYTDFARANHNNYIGAIGAQNGFDFGKNMMLMLEGYETVEEEMTEAAYGWETFFTGGCRLIGCESFTTGGRRGRQSHEVELGDSIIYIEGSDHILPTARPRKDPEGHFLQCRNCRIWIDNSMAPAGYQKQITAISVRLRT